MSFQTFEEFRILQISNQEAINEGLFDKLINMFSKVSSLFKDKEKIAKSVDAVVTKSGIKATKFSPRTVKVNETYFIVLGDGKNTATNFSISLTKLAELPDSSSLFQISGTSSTEMLKALTGTEKLEELSKNSVLALVSQNGFEKDKVLTMRLLKNIMPGGKDYVTKFLFQGAVPSVEVEKMVTTAV